MRLGISFHEDARIEFDEAADFYGMDLASLGVEFLGSVEDAVNHVIEFPDSCPVLAWPGAEDAGPALPVFGDVLGR